MNARVVAKKGVALFYSGKVGEFTIFLRETSSGFNIIKILINIIKISSIYSKSIKGVEYSVYWNLTFSHFDRVIRVLKNSANSPARRTHFISSLPVMSCLLKELTYSQST